MFETPGEVPDCKIKHQIDLIDQTSKPPKPGQCHMISAELAEVWKQLNKYLECG